MEKYLPILKKIPLFEGIADSDLLPMLHCLTAATRSYQKGELIFLAGQKASSVGVVLSGSVQIVKEDILGNRMVIAHLAQTDLFGEAYACAGTERLPITVQASADCVILFASYKRIITTCSSSCIFHTKLIDNMLHVLAAKNIQLNQKINLLGKRSIQDKLYGYFTDYALRTGSTSFEIPLNRQELADYLCVDRSAMSRELGNMQKSGIITYRKNHITILK